MTDLEHTGEARAAGGAAMAGQAASAAAFESLFERSPVGMVLADLRNRFIRVNEAFAHMLGYRPGELAGRSFMEVTHPDDVAASTSAPREALERGAPESQSLRLEKRYLHRDGREVWAEVSASLVNGPEGAPSHWVAQVLDVTGRRRVQAALRESEERLRLAVTHAPSPIMIHAEDGEILHLSDGWVRSSGYGPEQLRTIADWVRLAYGPEAPARHALIRSLFDGLPGAPGAAVIAEIDVRAADGSTRRWAFTSAPIGRGADGRRLAISMARDVTEQRAARAEAERTLAILHGVVEASPCAIFAVDRELRYTAFNSVHAGVMRALYGTEVAIGRSLRELQPIEEDHRQARENLGQALAGQTLTQEAYSGQPGPDRRWFEVTHYPVRDAGGEVIGAAVFARDLTARRNAEEALEAANAELQRSNEDLERFAYAASHDLQEPLRMVSSFLQLLERRVEQRLEPEEREFLRFAADGASRMQRLVADLLVFSRAGRLSTQVVPVDTGAALEEAVTNLELAIRETGAEVRRGPLPAVLATHSLLVQVFQNLLANALKFHGDLPPRVEVRGAEEGAGCHLEVRDQGIGIDPAHFDRVFQLFQRLHGPSRFTGSGIGLAVTKRVVERLGGRIWVESALGRGATFHVTLPRPVPREAAP